MRYETKKGLFKPKPLTISQVYKKKSYNERNFSNIIINFTQEKIIRDLLFKFINNTSFSLSVKAFERQLKLLESLTIDEQIRILNNTIEHGWNSLVFEYNKLMERMESF